MEKSLFIVDDHNMLLKGLKSYLEENSDWKVSETFTSAGACPVINNHNRKDFSGFFLIILLPD